MMAPQPFLDVVKYWPYRLSRFGVPILFVGLALLTRWLLEPALQGKLPYSFFYVAIILTAWCADIWETILAVLLGWVAAEWFFVEPRWSLLITGTEGWVGDGVYFFVGLAIVWFMKANQAEGLRASVGSGEMRRWREEQETQSTREILANLVENARNAIISLTPEGRITTWNPAAERLFGFSLQEVIGQPVNLIVPLERRTEYQSLLEKVNRGELIERQETELSHSNGSSVRVSLTLSSVRDRGGKLVGASIIAHELKTEVAGPGPHTA